MVDVMDKTELLAKAMFALYHHADWEAIGEYSQDAWKRKAERVQAALAENDFYITNE